MCGIAGFLQPGAAAQELQPWTARMLRPIAHRGPDDEGCWTDPTLGLALGHRRLAILELSPAGHQPMVSACGRLVIVFNGEIYNHAEIRAQLDAQGHAPARGWRGHSDTETLLEAIAAWGLAQALRASVGMFAMAVWDRQAASLTLARDRMGEKPLYYGWQGKAFLFGSELKALRGHPAFAARPDWSAASAVLELGYIPAPASIYEGIHKLPAGHVVTLLPQHVTSRMLPQSTPYWSLAEAALAAEQQPFAGSYPEAVDALEHLVQQSVHLQSMADVPVGAFLSGGIDSSTVVAMMQKLGGARVTTFSIGMTDAEIDESAMAEAVARHLGTDHVAHRIEPGEALALIPRLPVTWDEPFADASQLPTYLVSRIARQRVTVALSGDGGDELFLGYPWYPMLQHLWRLRGLRHLPWDTGFSAAGALGHLGSSWLRQRVGNARTVVGAWRQPDTVALNRYWMDRFKQDTPPLHHRAHTRLALSHRRRTTAETAALADAASYLPDDILVKVDRAAMASSLETRAPLLDHRIVEFALALPLHYKLQGRVGKRVLRDVLYRHVPRVLVDRPKMGFSIPLRQWLRGDLHEWAHSLLDEVPRDSHLFDREAVMSLWNEHQQGQDRTEHLWAVLSLVAWCKEYGASL